MGYLLDKCTFSVLNTQMVEQMGFDCGDDDLNEFFRIDAHLQQRELLCKNYCFIEENATEGQQIVAAFTLSNDSIKKIPNSRKKKIEKDIDRTKHYFSYPAVMIGRLGIARTMQNKHIGGELIRFIKAWFLDPLNKTGCRFILVDSYKTARNLHFYESSGFEYLFSSEEQEKEFRGMKPEKELKTRLMYFDMKVLTQIQR